MRKGKEGRGENEKREKARREGEGMRDEKKGDDGLIHFFWKMEKEGEGKEKGKN